MNKVTIYHKDYCPYCKAAKQLLTQQGFEYNAIDVTNDPAAFAAMVKKSDRRTVPQIFIGNTHIGGFDDLQARFSSKKFPFNQLEIT
ncbi:glutaredoxin 3 [Pseudoalteromonas sp. MMG012]|uniref:glutaredoxin 3 n=1 Tax=Pseudoalteromonas sp. MMG012 TaxID=2822686 RepID=UPI001B3A4EDF|nr:glutaredoxin 3 [Pseudoalteromonas sp. MMG012]MBQ4852788.1 glutaredoxin 3 [Pseudoalteromonas sp. MMG012]